MRLRKRADFVAAQRGKRRHTRFFTLQVRDRSQSASEIDEDQPRFGVTVTKKTDARATRRNRIRRRLREALRAGAAKAASQGVDYVLIARIDALNAPFEALKDAIADTLTEKKRRQPHNISGAQPKDRPSTR
jgi:ribonuclease P protein component